MALGAFGVAAATIPAGKSGGGGLLIEWAIPLLEARGPDPALRVLVLHSLRICLAHVGQPVLGVYASRAAVACRDLLESDETGAALLGPALAALVVIAERDADALKVRFRSPRPASPLKHASRLPCVQPLSPDDAHAAGWRSRFSRTWLTFS